MVQETLSRLLIFDQKLRTESNVLGSVAGVDEAGRGPLAGPVVAAAVILIRPQHLLHLNDSKQVKSRQRDALFWGIIKHSLFGIGIANESEIDKINIYHASRLAMKRAVLDLPRTPDFLFIDGKARLEMPIAQKTIVKGDALSASVAAASIVAKVYRDFWMKHLDHLYPGYDFARHKGYGTRRHLEKLKEKGPSEIHRKTFEPVRILLEKRVS